MGLVSGELRWRPWRFSWFGHQSLLALRPEWMTGHWPAVLSSVLASIFFSDRVQLFHVRIERPANAARRFSVLSLNIGQAAIKRAGACHRGRYARPVEAAYYK